MNDGALQVHHALGLVAARVVVVPQFQVVDRAPTALERSVAETALAQPAAVRAHVFDLLRSDLCGVRTSKWTSAELVCVPSRSARCKSVQKATGTDRLETAGAAGAQCGVGARAALLFALLPPTCGTAWLFPIPSLSPPSVVRPGFLPNVKLAFSENSAGEERGERGSVQEQ